MHERDIGQADVIKGSYRWKMTTRRAQAEAGRGGGQDSRAARNEWSQ